MEPQGRSLTLPGIVASGEGTTLRGTGAWLVSLTIWCCLSCDTGVTLAGEGEDGLAADSGEAGDGGEGGPEDVLDLGADEGDAAAPRCGNDRLEEGEDCDQSEPGACVTPCGTEGRRPCADCRWGACAPPAEECNGVDDDCNGWTDDVVPGVAGCGNGCCAGGEDSCGCPTDCGPPLLPAPVPLRPANAARVPTRTPVFEWVGGDSVCGPPTFFLDVDDSCPVTGFDSCGFPSPELRVVVTGRTRFEVEAPLPVSDSPPVGRRYWWRVRSCEGDACSPWSPVRYFDLGRVVLDFNGDGFSDLAVGSPSRTGTVYVYSGGPDGIDPSRPAVLNNPESGEWEYGFGAYLADGGDLDADGFGDLVVGSHRMWRHGSVHVYFGGPSGISPVPAVTIREAEGSFRCGMSIAGLADPDVDGFSDAAVGAPCWPLAATTDLGPGAVFWYGGAAARTVPLAARLDSPTGVAGDMFGSAVLSAGDTDGNGHDDLLVAAPWQAGGFTGRGCVHLFRAGAGGFPATPSASWCAPPGEGAIDAFGLGLGRGDLDGDGYSDVLVGAVTTDTEPQGAVFAYRGGPAGRDGFPWRRFDPAWPGATGSGIAFGSSRIAVCDVDGDGDEDLFVGAAGVDLDASDHVESGAVFWYRGDVGGPPAVPGAALESPGRLPDGRRHQGRFGEVVVCGSDWNGDGFVDLAVGAPQEPVGDPATGLAGRAYLYYGSASGLSAPLVLEEPVPTSLEYRYFASAIAG